MSNYFDQALVPKPKRNVFDLSHERKFTMNFGVLTPILCEEVLPGDSWSVKSEILLRTVPLVNPMYHRVNVFTHFFYVPYRLVWDDFEDFITGGPDGTEEPVVPTFTLTSGGTTMKPGSLADFLGFPSWATLPSNQQINALPFRAYHHIWNEYYRDQNTQDEYEFLTTSGLSTAGTLYTLKYRNWQRDYFTSGLPTPLRGAEVSLPIQDAPVNLANQDTDQALYYLDGPTLTPYAGGPVESYGDQLNSSSSGGVALWLDPQGTMEADMSSATPTIEQLRLALKLQQWMERNNIAGGRFEEQVLAHFGVRVPDFRLKKAEFLGGGMQPLQISAVAQTSESGTTPQGSLAGLGIAIGNTHGFKKFFVEHGYIMGIMSVMPKSAYCQGFRRHLLKTDKFDYFFPEFAQLGEQPIYKGELWASGTPATDLQTWAYQSRYAEYKYIPSSVHGFMKPIGGSDPMEYWTMTRAFTSLPALNSDFITYENDVERVFPTSETGDKLVVNIYHNIRAVRPIPYFNNPSLI